MEKLVKILAVAIVGWVVAEVAEDALESIGVPKQAAVIAGGIIGGLI